MAIEEDLDLDISAALRDVDRVGNALERVARDFRTDVNRALQSATSNVDIDIDPAALRRSVDQALARIGQVDLNVDEPRITAQINQAVARANDLRLGVDAFGITAAVNAALARANNNVTVTADASSVTGAVNAALANANNTVTINGQANIAGLNDAADQSTILAGGLKTAAAALAGFVGVDAILRIVDASSDLEEAQAKANAVFGDSIDLIEEFGATSAAEFGIARGAAFETTATFGNLFTSAGVAQQRAAELSVSLAELGADLASFNNLDVDDALIKLRAGLAGEIEPLRAIGVSFTAAEVEARALELGLVDLGGELDEQAKLLARYDLILEKSANAQGDFARTSDGLANQQRILQAQFQEILSVVGAPLVSPLLSILQTAVPAAGDAADAFGRLVGAILPALDALVQGAGPALDATFDGIGDAADALAPALLEVGETLGIVLGAAGPVIEVAADLVGGVAEVVATMAAFEDGLGLVVVAIPLVVAALASMLAPSLAAIGGISGLGLALQGLWVTMALNPITTVIVLLGVLATALAGANFAAGDAADGIDAVATQTDALRGAFASSSESIFEQARAVSQLDKDFADYIETQSAFSTDDQVADLQSLGLSYDEIRDQLQSGAEGVNEFAKVLTDAGQIQLQFADTTKAQAFVNGDLEQSITGLIAAGEVQLSGNEQLLVAFQNETLAIQSLNYETFQSLIATGQLTDAQADLIVAEAEARGETDLYGAALRTVAGGLDEINAKLPETEVPLAQQGASWAALSDAILRGQISSTDYQAVADELGVSLDVVSGFADSVTESLDAFVAKAVDGLPKASEAFRNYVGDFGEANSQSVIDNLNLQALAIQEFIDDIARIREESPEAADFLLQLGQASAGPFAADLADGKVSIEDFNEALGNQQGALDRAEEQIRNSAIDSAAYELGAQASEELGLGMDFTKTTQEQIDNVADTLRSAATGNASNAASDLGTAIGRDLTRAMKDELGINSPSRVFQQIGVDTIAGFERGILTSIPGLVAAAATAQRDLTGGFTAPPPGIVSPVAAGNTFATDRSSVTLTANVEVNGGADPQATGDAVAAAVTDVFAEVLSL